MVFIITGGGSGIGRSLAIALAKRGKSILVVGRKTQLLQETAAHSSLIRILCADISTEEGLSAVQNAVCDEIHLEGLVNNAGTLNPIAPIQEIQAAQWHQTLKTNLDAALFLPQKLHQQLIHGRVLNIGSGAAYFAIKGWAAYCVSKAALAMLTRCWQLESDEVAYASVMPGIIDTQMQAIAREGKYMDDSQTHFYQNLKDTDRLVSPETVAEFLAWLLLDTSSELYVSKEWDIYDTSHHKLWLRAPHRVPHWE